MPDGSSVRAREKTATPSSYDVDMAWAFQHERRLASAALTYIERKEESHAAKAPASGSISAAIGWRTQQISIVEDV